MPTRKRKRKKAAADVQQAVRIAENLPAELTLDQLKRVYRVSIKNLELVTKLLSERDLEILDLKARLAA